MILKDPYVSLNGIEFDVKSVELSHEVETQDVTDSGSEGTRNHVASFKNWSASFSFNQEFGENQIDEFMFDTLGQPIAMIIRPSKAPVSRTNPQYAADGLSTNHSPVSGSVSDSLEAALSLVPTSAGSGSHVLQRTIS